MNAVIARLTLPIDDTRATTVFCKALFVYFALKIVLSWQVLMSITTFHLFSHPKGLLASIVLSPAAFAAQHIHLFLSISLITVLAAIVVKPNYVLSALVASFALNLYRILFPVANGSDQVLTVLLFFAIPLSAFPVMRHETGAIVQSGIYHGARLFCQLYIASIYLISGIDKLGSEAWRSGEAIAYVGQLRYMIPPGMADIGIPESTGGKLAMAWCTIVFELAFPVLVWFRITRTSILLCGVFFHLAIAFLLSLPDFGMIMILAYLVYLNNGSFDIFRRKTAPSRA